MTSWRLWINVFTQAIAVVTMAMSRPAFANPNDCYDVVIQLTYDQLQTRIAEIVTEMPDMAFLYSANATYSGLAAPDRDFARILPPGVVKLILSDAEMLYYSRRLSAVLEETVNRADLSRSDALRESFRQALKGQVPDAMINERIPGDSESNLDLIRRALGDMNVVEVNMLLRGADHKRPSPESLVGQYIAETGAATLERAFPLRPGSAELGPVRLVVALSTESFPAWKRYFNRHEFMSVIGHAEIVHDGILHSYNGTRQPLGLPGTANKILPFVVLKTTEAQRLTQFLNANTKYSVGGSWSHAAQQPWRLLNYCGTSHYTNCTQKIGIMPIGDRLVTSYAFPGDNDGGRAAPPIVRDLQPYVHADPLIKRVWKVPGNEQFADVIGQGAANLRGDFASPGWVITTLIGPTSVERVPVVFVIRADHRAPIDPNFKPEFEQPL